MTVDEFDIVAKVICLRDPRFGGRRIKDAYVDLINIDALASEVERDVRDQDLFRLSDEGKHEQWAHVMERHGQMVSLLKSMFMFANVFVDLLLNQVMSTRATLKSFLASPVAPLQSLRTDRILPAYCVVAYRHKIIAHHDVVRYNGMQLGGTKGPHRLFPIPEAAYISHGLMPSDDATILAELKDRYFPAGSAPKDVYEQTEKLFYSIPLGPIGQLNPDRKRIDRIAEVNGCKSMSRNEIVMAMDTLIAEIADAVRNP